MAIGSSIVLIALGAILAMAVNYHAAGVDIQAVGVILMVAGALGIALSLVFWSTFGAWSWMPPRRYIRRDVVDREVEEPVVYDDSVERRTVIREERHAPRVRHPRT